MPASRIGPIKRLLSLVVMVCCCVGAGAAPCTSTQVARGRSKVHIWSGMGSCSGFRFGEADNPGPNASFCLSTSNPSGLRAKEGIVCEFPPGIHCVAESQLSNVTLPTSAGTLRSLARKQNRSLRVMTGAPAAIRSHSSWAGTWTGVLATSDFPSRGLTIEWPPGVFESGRVLLTYHDVGGLPVSGAVVYGYASSATHPQSRAATDDLLTTITKQLVLGRPGPRFVAGDFNHSPEDLSEIQHWLSLGWVEVQSLANARWQQQITPTCKNKTVRDMIFVSPELACWCQAVSVGHCFADHATVFAHFGCPSQSYQQRTWPLPSTIPWEVVDVEAWCQSQVTVPTPDQDSTQWLRRFAETFETSLDGFAGELPDSRLPKACKGRAKNVEPQLRRIAPSLARPSRQGEAQLSCDLVGHEVVTWFKQLRRIQSMQHSLLAGRQEANAQTYRAELWHKIKASRGFCGGFQIWWGTRRIKLQGSPTVLPEAIPSWDTCVLIFEDFQANFRAFESWHNRNRNRILNNRHEQGKDQLFTDLKKPASAAVDTIQCRKSYTILDVDNDGQQAAFESPIDSRGESSWTINGVPCIVHSVDGPVCVVETEAPLVPGQELQQVQILSRADHIHEEFVCKWSARWQKHANVPPSVWSRIMAFSAAFLPPGSFDLTPLTPEAWYRALRKYKPHAARGADGFAKQDLAAMPMHLTQSLLDLLHRIEAGSDNWPEQVLVGLVMSLDKENGKDGADSFRPICVLSLIYRTWASLRAKQLLRRLALEAEGGLHGFLPKRESKEMWFAVQTAIECSALLSRDLIGYSTDLVAAFNTLPRLPVFHAAGHVGVPQPLLHAWGGFLHGLRRFFQVRGELSPPVLSRTGFPEGCPLSTCAMVLVDLSWHCYQRHFSPPTIPLSFVDNLTCLARTTADLVQSFGCSESFASMWDLEVDHDKTFAWAIHPRSKAILSTLGFTVVDEAKDLGGLMTFGRRTRTSIQREMCKALEPLWLRLKRSKASTQAKTAVLPAKVWSSVLHGTAGCWLSKARLASLRAAATRAVGLQSAGASSALRLVLAPCMTSDPGFFSFWTLLQDIRRIGLKNPRFHDQLAAFVSQFRGQHFPGPFSSLLKVCTEVGLEVRPPYLVSQQGFRVDLFRAPKNLVRRFAEQAWVDSVALQHTHRQTMKELSSIDLCLARLDHKKLTRLEHARVWALQSGANIANAQHGRYDNTKDVTCAHCNELDTVEHKVRYCRLYDSCRLGSEQTLARWDELPKCLTHHLLVPANPHLDELKRSIQSIPDTLPQVQLNGRFEVWHDVFTDGTCLFDGELALAAWAVVDMTTGRVCGTGPLTGLAQTVPRAELRAALYALQWAALNQVCLALWSDSLYVVEGVNTLLSGGDVLDCWDNHDLWVTMLEATLQLGQSQLKCRHVPSHLDVNLCENVFEEWVAKGNNWADRQADMTNRSRPQELVSLHGRALAHFQTRAKEIRDLRDVYLRIADITGASRPVASIPDEDDAPVIWLEREGTISDGLRPAWRHVMEARNSPFPLACLDNVAETIFELDEGRPMCTAVSWVELAFIFKGQGFQFWHRARCSWVPVQDSYHGPRPTLSGCIDFVRKSCTEVIKGLGREDLFLSGIDVSSLGVVGPCEGLYLGVAFDVLQKARTDLRSLAASRPFRRAADFSRAF